MDIFVYQQLAARTEKHFETREMRLIHGHLGLSSETGEIADAVKKHVVYSQPLDVKNLSEELGDLMWYIALMANAGGLNLSDVLDGNIAKLQRRYPEKYSDHHAAARLDKEGEA